MCLVDQIACSRAETEKKLSRDYIPIFVEKLLKDQKLKFFITSVLMSYIVFSLFTHFLIKRLFFT